MKMGEHSGKLKSVMQMRCMINLVPWGLAAWTLGGPDLLELNLPFIADQFPLPPWQISESRCHADRWLLPSPAFVGSGPFPTLSGRLVLWGRGWGEHKTTHKTGARLVPTHPLTDVNNT